MDHTWSLGVEEHFYLLLPIALLALIAGAGGGKNPFRRLPLFCAAVALLLLAMRIFTDFHGRYGDQHNLEPTHLRLDSLLCGVLLLLLLSPLFGADARLRPQIPLGPSSPRVFFC